MTEVPKIVYDRLQAASPQSLFGESHPDADLLNAFAELAISATERDRVLQHLANCGDCRDVVALALPPVEIGNNSTVTEDENDLVGAQTRAPQSSRGWLSSFRFAAPTLRWAAMAAGIAVVASVLLVRPGMLRHGTIPSANSTVPSANPQIAKAPQTELLKKFESHSTTNATSPAGPEVLMAENKIAPEARDLDRAMSDRAVSNRAVSDRAMRSTDKSALTSMDGTLKTRSDALSIEKAKPASPAIEAEVSLAANQPNKAETSLSDSSAADSRSSASSAPSEDRSQEDRSQEDRSQESSSQKDRSQGGSSSPGGSSTGSSNTDLSHAHSATFTVVGGILQRSLDNGQSWLNALHADHSLLCYAVSGHNVWTGGEAGALFHSVDDGVTWVRVQASVGAQTLASDITRIDLSNRGSSSADTSTLAISSLETSSLNGGVPATVVVSTLNQGVWSSADGGNTWQNK